MVTSQLMNFLVSIAFLKVMDCLFFVSSNTTLNLFTEIFENGGQALMLKPLKL